MSGPHPHGGRGWRRSLPWPITLTILLATFAIAVAALLRDCPPAKISAATGTPVASPEPAPLPDQRTIGAAFDAYVDASESAVAIARTAKLRVDGDPRVYAVVQFDLRGVRTPIRQAELRIFSTSGSRIGFQARLVHVGPLDESAVTLGLAEHPARSAVGYSGGFNAASWASADVTSVIAGLEGRVVTVAISTAAPTNISFASLESGDRGPRLALSLRAPSSAGAGSPPPSPPTEGAGVDVLVAGDIATCDGLGDEATGTLLSTVPAATVLTLGDNVYETGSAAQFTSCYAPSWGPSKRRTRPVPGNHDYLTGEADPYFDYFGDSAGDRTKGYYSFDLGSWHLIALNSNCVHVGGCGEGSPQLTWLRDDLTAHASRCTLAYWHHPLFSSGQHGRTESMRPIWQALVAGGVEIALAGHDHDYERFAPQDDSGNADPQRGVRGFVVGTGGKGMRPFGTVLPNSEARNDSALGVLHLRLRPDGYEWRFLPTVDGAYSDSGSGTCH